MIVPKCETHFAVEGSRVVVLSNGSQVGSHNLGWPSWSNVAHQGTSITMPPDWLNHQISKSLRASMQHQPIGLKPLFISLIESL